MSRMQTSLSVVLILAVVLNSELIHSHVLPYHGQINGVHHGVHSSPLLPVAKVAAPAVLASSSATFRQYYSGMYYPYQYPGEYPPFPSYYYPPYPPPPADHSLVHELVFAGHQQVPPNSSISKLPPLLEGFVQRIQNLLSHYNLENHKPTTTTLVHGKPYFSYGWSPHYVLTTLPPVALTPQGTVPPTMTEQPMEMQPGEGMTTVSPMGMASGANEMPIGLPPDMVPFSDQGTVDSVDDMKVARPGPGLETMMMPPPPPPPPTSTPQPQDSGNKNTNAQPESSPPDNNGAPSVPSNNNRFPTITAYGVPDAFTPQTPPPMTSTTVEVSFTTPETPERPAPPKSDQIPTPGTFEYGPPRRDSVPRFGGSLHAREIVALISQYGFPVEDAQIETSKTPGSTLTAPGEGGTRYSYDQPIKPFRYPSPFN